MGVAGLVAQVGLLLRTGVPHTLDGVNGVVARVLVLVEPDVVEDEELGLGAEVGGVGQAGGHEMVLGLLGHVAGVTAVALPRYRVPHEAVDVERLVLTEGVDHGGVGVGDQEHVRLLDLLEAPNRGAIEAVAVLEAIGRQLVGGHGEVLHEAGEVTEAEVDDLDALVLGQAQDLGRGSSLHVSPPRGQCPSWGSVGGRHSVARCSPGIPM